jgi:molecular chaperone DnaK (HSP70)
VTFDIDANGILKVKAQDKQTKQQQQIRIEPNSGLKEEEISRMLGEAQKQSAVNKESGELAQYRVTCQKLLEESLKEVEQGRLGSHEREEMKAALQALGAGMDGSNLDGLKSLLKDLNSFLIKIRLQNRVPGAV